MQNVKEQMSFSKEIDIKAVLERKKRKQKRNFAAAFITAVCFLLIFITDVPSSVANLFGTSPGSHHPYGSYLIHNTHYYIPTNKSVSKVRLDRELGTISRSGDWIFLREGDTSEYITGSKYYSIQGKSTEEAIAVEVIGGTKQKPVIEKYQVLKRAEQVEKVDQKAIFGGKNDPKEVQTAYKNIQEVVPFLRTLQSPELEMTSIVLRNDGSHYYIKMMYRPTKTSSMGQTIDLQYKHLYKSKKIDMINTIDKTIFIQEYQDGFGKGKEEFKHTTTDGDFPYDVNKRVATFTSNGFEWVQYNRTYADEYPGRFDKYDHVYRAKSNGIIYEVSSQGCSIEEVKKLLETFVQIPNK